MKKIALIAFLLAVCVAAGRAQESRQDISLSGTALIEPFIASSTDCSGALEPRLWRIGSATVSCLRHPAPSRPTTASPTRTTFTTLIANTNNYNVLHPHPGDFGRLRPQLHLPQVQSVCRGGAGRVHLSAHPQLRHHHRWTSSSRLKSAALYGAGIAYEISPSFDIRAEYRGLVTKVPTFGETGSSPIHHQQVVQHLQPGHRRGISLLSCTAFQQKKRTGSSLSSFFASKFTMP